MKSLRNIILGTLIFSLSWGIGWAEPTEADPTKKTTSKLPAPPTGLENKQGLTEKQYERKLASQGSDHSLFGLGLSGICGPKSSPDEGFGLGCKIYYINNGQADNPFFAYSPYEHQVYLTVFGTVNGYKELELNWDAPYFMRSLYRVRASAYLLENIVEKYYGADSSSMNKLSIPEQLRMDAGLASATFDKFEDQLAELRKVRNTGSGDFSYSQYNNYIQRRLPEMRLLVSRDMLGGFLRPSLGGKFVKYQIEDFSNKAASADKDGETVSGITNRTTKLAEDCAAGKILGCPGNYWDNTIRLGVAYDRRDFEPNPENGVYADVSFEISSKSLGSAYDYTRLSVAPSIFYNPFTGIEKWWSRMVLATKFQYVQSDGDVPFYVMQIMPNERTDYRGVGGARSVRAYRTNRFMGKVMSQWLNEIRWTFLSFDNGNYEFVLTPFVDTGRVFDSPQDIKLNGWKVGYGAGLDVVLWRSTVIVFDYAVSDEDAGFYINVGYTF